MKSAKQWILSKDFRASGFSWPLYLLFALGVECLLAFQRTGNAAFPLQLTVWLFALWILLLRANEDSPNAWDTRWLASRPLRRDDVNLAKFLYFLLFLVLPLLLIRLSISLILGLGFFNGILTGLHTAVVLLWPGLLLLKSKGYVLPPVLLMSVLTLSMLLTVLTGFRGQLRISPSESLTFYPATPGQPYAMAELLDPWLRIGLAPDQMLGSSSLSISFSWEDEHFRVGAHRNAIRNDLNEGEWFRHFQRIQPQRPLLSPVPSFSLSARTLRRTTEIRQGTPTTVYVNTRLPDALSEEEKRYTVNFEFVLLHVLPVWQGTLQQGITLHDQVRGRIRNDQNGTIELHLTAAATHGLTGPRAFGNWFGGGLGAVTVESAPDTPLLVLPAKITPIQTGFPAFTRSYRLLLHDPRPFFPAGATLSLTVHSATTPSRRRHSHPFRMAPDPDRRTLMNRFESLDLPSPPFHPPTGLQAQHPPPTDNFGSALDRAFPLSAISELSDPRRAVGTRTQQNENRIRRNFQPQQPDDLAALLDRLPLHPHLIDWLPDSQRPSGVQRLRETLRHPPLANPTGLLFWIDTLQLVPEAEDFPGIAWALIHADRLDLLSNLSAPVWLHDRPPLRFFDLLPPDLRAETWAQVWQRIRADLPQARRIALRPEYMLEALRRQSPDAPEAVRQYLALVTPETFTDPKDLADLAHLTERFGSLPPE